MNQIKIVSSKKKFFSETYDIRLYKRRRMGSFIIVNYRINAKYHQKKNE